MMWVKVDMTWVKVWPKVVLTWVVVEEKVWYKSVKVENCVSKTEGTAFVEAECRTCSDAYGWLKLPTCGRTYVTVVFSLPVVGTASTRSV